ncbi:MAG: hypothetical protein WC965_01075 [Thiohalomonadaceae bacterium]
MNQAVADHYADLKTQEAALKKALAAASEKVNALLDEGKEVVTSDGVRYVRQTAYPRTYKVSGLKGILAFIRNNPNIDAASFLSVKAAAVQKLPEALQEQLTFTTKPVDKIVVGR